MKRTLNIAASVLLAAAVLVSCEPGPAGLFAMLEKEKPLNKGTPALNANTAAFVARVDGATDYYYAGVGATLLRRPVTGGAWETVTIPGAPAGSVITDGVASGAGIFYISFAPAKRTIFTYSGGTWTSNFQQGSLPDAPVQSLLFDGTNLYASTSTTADKATYYSISYSDGVGAFSSHLGVQNQPCGKPSAVAIGAGKYWITAGNTVFKGNDPGTLDIDSNAGSAGISASKPVFSVFTSGATVVASGTGTLFKLEDSGYTPSASFGSAVRHLSSVVVVPKNGGGNATLVGVKSWASDKYTGYYEYDALLNAGAFGSVVPSTAYDMISDNSNYVTTLDDLSIEGFYYDPTGYTDAETTHLNRVLFARTVGGGLWSNHFDTVTQTWSGWDRE